MTMKKTVKNTVLFLFSDSKGAFSFCFKVKQQYIGSYSNILKLECLIDLSIDLSK